MGGIAGSGEGDPMIADRLDLERVEHAVARMPRADAAQDVVRPGFPHRAELPAERVADRLEHCRIDLDRPVRFREDPCRCVLGTLEPVPVREPCARPLEVCHRQG